MTIQINTAQLTGQERPPELSVRRDPLTGKVLGSTGAEPQPASRLQRLLAHNPLLDTEIIRLQPGGSDAADPLERIAGSASARLPQAPVHAETISPCNPISLESASLLLAQYIKRFTELIPSPTISELSIEETCFEGQLSSQISGFISPTDLTHTVDEQAIRWGQRTGGDLLADVLASEIVAGERLLANNEHWVAYVPYASVAPCEIMLIPKAASRNLVATTDASRADLDFTYRQILGALMREYGAQVSYTATWSMAPIPHCRAISRMRVHFEVDAPAASGKSPEAIAQNLHRYF